MPHKRAKRSVREKMRADKKSDLPPSQALLSDDTPKSMTRILNAEATQRAWRERKRALADEGGDGEGAKRKKRKTSNGHENQAKQSGFQIKPGESLKHFNRRVEDDMRPLVRTAMKNTTSVSKQKAKASERDTAQTNNKSGNLKTVADTDDDEDSSPSRKSKGKEPVKDFARTSSSKPKRLNDIVQAPPDLKIAPRLKRLVAAAQDKVKKRSGDDNGTEEVEGSDVLSIAQKRMMELERDKAIRHYRALKEAKAKGLHTDREGIQ